LTQSGIRVPKDDPIFEALGTADELNTVLGWCRCACSIDWMVGGKSVSAILLNVQNHIFTIQKKKIPQKSVKQIEEQIAIIDEQIPEITSFFVPGGSELSARLDIARAVSRRAERRLVSLNSSEKEISEYTLTYSNRLSSLLYGLVRLVNYKEKNEEQKPEYI